MMSEMGGIQVASSSPSLGAMNVRIQGMRGRYTRFLSDGLPLFGEQVGGFGLIQIPPADLGQVEVIKGVASALYGAGAMGGVVNLIARRPTEHSQEFIVNRSVYGYVRAREYEGIAFEDVPLTPRHSLTVLGGMEDDEIGRFVVELFYTGGQRLEANPFRDESVPFATIGLLFEKVFGKLRVFVNAEDLNNVRQTQYDALVRPTQGADGRWTVDAWAPLDGRNINGGIRLKF